ncbi:VOC family protein [Microbacterium sp.]|uniref:VOC family protein n=1 Tax=Microbacterium sp. TaxID=51671 RepID=UPI0025D2AF9C|nr:VOC family protein [Microbacterium sp.]
MSLVTLGVNDLERSIRFYRALGWEPHPSSVAGEVAFYQAGGLVVGLWSRRALAADSGTVDSGGWGGVTLAHNVVSRDEVDSVLTDAEAAGARIGRRAAETDWGGYSGIFIDPDGHPWEVAVNPGWTIDETGRTLLR